MLEVVERALVDIDRFPADDQAFVMDLQARLAQVVADGPEQLDAGDITALAGGVARVVELLTEQSCDGFLGP